MASTACSTPSCLLAPAATVERSSQEMTIDQPPAPVADKRREADEETLDSVVASSRSALSRIPFIGQLSKLQELENFSAGKKPGFMINELKNMQELTGKLSISNIHIIKNVHEAKDANMIEKKHLESFELKGKIVLRDVLEGLQPHMNLQELTIEGYGARIFLDWMLQGHVFTNLQYLHVVNCRLLEVLSPFGKFPSLKHLTLDSLPSMKHADGTSFGCLQNLEEFKVSSMRAWVVWSHVEQDHGPFLPHVKKFQLLNCPVLE
ncbi:hypothetical protein ACQ4PT_036187 [Festuca glaucescens]